METLRDDQGERGLGPDPQTVFAVLVVLPGGLGSVLKAVPALRHLRSLYAAANIQVAMHRSGFELLAGCPLVDECVDIARPGTMLLSSYDVAISFADPAERTSRSTGLQWRLESIRARVHAGYRRADDAATLAIHPVRPHRVTATARMLHLAWLLGGERSEAKLALWPRLVDRNGAAELLEVAGAAPLALIHACASKPQRRWGERRFARVVDVVHGLGLTPVLVGLPEDAADNAQIVAAATSPVLDLTGVTGVGVLGGLMERASLFVGVDSGPAVLAGVMGTRSVVIGPASGLEQMGSAGVVRYLTIDHVARDGEDLPDACDVDEEAVLAAVTLAAHQAAEQWQATRIA